MANTLQGVVLPIDIQWIDEFDWSPVGQKVETTVTGGLVIQESSQQAGRPITLGGGDGGEVWTTRGVIKSLYTLAAMPSLEMALALDDGRNFTVVFRRDNDSPILTAPVLARLPAIDSDEYTLKIQLMTV